MEETRDRGALSTGNPQIARPYRIYELSCCSEGLSCLPSVKNDVELDKRIKKMQDKPEKMTDSLGRGSNANLSVILSIHEVWDACQGLEHVEILDSSLLRGTLCLPSTCPSCVQKRGSPCLEVGGRTWRPERPMRGVWTAEGEPYFSASQAPSRSGFFGTGASL